MATGATNAEIAARRRTSPRAR
ncbi:MAG: hypothetical protein R2719_00970 [Micropruina sp.]